MREAKPDFTLTFLNAGKHTGPMIPFDKRAAFKSFAAKTRRESSSPSPSGAALRRRMSAISIASASTNSNMKAATISTAIEPRDSTSNKSLVPASRPTMSPRGLSRRNSNSFLALNGDVTNASNELVGDLERENEDIKEQLESTKTQLAMEHEQLERQRSEQQQKLEEEARKARESIEQITKARDDMVAVNRVLLSQQRLANKSHRLALERERKDVEAARTEIQQSQDMIIALEQQIQELQHEKAALGRQWQELQEEHRDATRNVEELHERLLEAQNEVTEAQRAAVEAQREAGEARAARESDMYEEEDEEEDNESSSELSRVLRNERRRSMSDAGFGGAKTTRRRSSNSLVPVSNPDELAMLALEKQKLLEQVAELQFANETSQRLLNGLRSELQDAREREQEINTVYSEQLVELSQEMQAKQVENEGLRRALVAVESHKQSEIDARNRDNELLAHFKQLLSRGITLTKYGARGQPHARVVYADPACRWLSWRAPAANLSLTLPRPDARVDTSDLVAVVAGATTDVFLRQRVDNDSTTAASGISSLDTTCLSLVMLNPCRTLDLQAESAEQCRFYLRGFQLLCEEAATKRQRLMMHGQTLVADDAVKATPGEGGLAAASPMKSEQLQLQPNHF